MHGTASPPAPHIPSSYNGRHGRRVPGRVLQCTQLCSANLAPAATALAQISSDLGKVRSSLARGEPRATLVIPGLIPLLALLSQVKSRRVWTSNSRRTSPLDDGRYETNGSQSRELKQLLMTWVREIDPSSLQHPALARHLLHQPQLFRRSQRVIRRRALVHTFGTEQAMTTARWL